MHPCATCAGIGGDCCRNNQIFVTPGDVERIRAVCDSEFYGWEPQLPKFLVCEEDPEWPGLTIDERGLMRCLLRNGVACIFLTSTGCQLSAEVRPLVCRLYPYMFDRRGLLGVCSSCPISEQPNAEETLRQLAMDSATAWNWIEMLYREIDESRRTSTTAA